MLKFRTMGADAEVVLTTLMKFDALPEPAFKLCPDPQVPSSRALPTSDEPR